jgi:hypothetical protein
MTGNRIRTRVLTIFFKLRYLIHTEKLDYNKNKIFMDRKKETCLI